MKIYSIPAEMPYADPDWANFDPKAEAEREEDHRMALHTWLIHAGHNGEHTGRILSIPVGDGYASYMFMDSGEKSALIHLPYGEGYQSRDAALLPREDVLRRLDAADRLHEAFARARADRDETPTLS